MSELVNKSKLFIFSKNGTLCPGVVEKNGKSHAPNTLETQEYYPEVSAKCAELKANGHSLAVVSNEGGVAFGILAADEAELLVKTAMEFIDGNAFRVSFYHPRGNTPPWNQDHRSRMPQPGMLIELMQQLNFKPSDTVMVGDWESDREAAQAAGCTFIWANEFFERDDDFSDRLHAAMGVK